MTLDEAITDGMQHSGRGREFYLESPTAGTARVEIDASYVDPVDWGLAGTMYTIVLKLTLYVNSEFVDQVTMWGESDNDWCDMDWSHPDFRHNFQSNDWTWHK